MAVEVQPTPAPPPPPPDGRGRDANRRGCRFGQSSQVRNLSGFGCPCCDMGSKDRGYDAEGKSASFSSTAKMALVTRELTGLSYVDTHCHLGEVLQEVFKRNVAPSLEKDPDQLTDEESRHWRTIGWLEDQVGDEAQLSSNPTWEKRWIHLQLEQCLAAQELGYTQNTWDRHQWLLPRNTSWKELPAGVRQNLRVLSESEASWDKWQAGGRTLTSAASCELRRWSALSEVQQKAASALGFTETVWNCE
ncbi:unnamed protein product, partial [Polarella glacialis]